ncbi:3-hydroxy acid dehydrogenase [Malassezia vespertilionis]|uniref:Uncharacterized protein n=1 Tax=Malassezia vespertilionis TaxID=2020962 RepID=A0A2N1JEF2_9BASI|nr:3-hydroxy acid dehydrogenase [Malassezia vespertilionis]PKI84927.1 hypothetical protein MVES_001078 [Malassezia vespertilionis]WFD05810.1 3-hydroxy acid dehydrogenase [Malassezia vespertilionis]
MATIFSTARLHNKVVLVTGASSGIGAATAVLFSMAGANVVLAARRAEKLAEIEQACIQANKDGGTGKGGRYATLSLDVNNHGQVDSILSALPDWAAQVDVLVNNAGLALGTERVGDLKFDDVDRMLDTNVRGLIRMTQVFVNMFKARDAGHIINVGSIAGVEPYPGGSVYCASKFAVRAFTSALMKELYDTQIRVSNIQPGMVETEFSIVRFHGDKQNADKVYAGIEPLAAQDIADEIVWAASRAPHVNIAEVLIMPTNQAGPFHVARSTAK